jgi:hypothetical protein
VKAAPFRYPAPQTVVEVEAALPEYGDEAKVLSAARA